jgi:DNA (cytosine-5)-methyltransferase 1
VCAVEIEDYPRRVLLQRQADGFLPRFPIWDDICTFDGKPWREKVDVISGGFPCQDISAAGKGAGLDGERSGLWGEMARVIHEVQPRFVFVENSPMLTSRGLGRVLGDLASMGFDARWGVLGAADIGANHKRDRIWIVAKWRGQLPHAQHNRIRRWEQQSQSIKKTSNNVANPNCITRGSLEGRRSSFNDSKECGDLRRVLAFDSGNEQKKTREILANTPSVRQQGQRQHEQPINSTKGRNWQTNYVESIGRPEFWAIEPNVGRVANGVAARVDRLKAIGNGQVPLCAATAWRILSESS